MAAGRFESAPDTIGPITLDVKQTGKRSAGNPHAAFDEAGAGNVTTGAGLRTNAKVVGTATGPYRRRASPRPHDGRCHHEVGWRIATETMRHCVLSGWDPATKRRTVLALKEPYAKPLDRVDDNSILAFRLDAAIRALAPAAVAGICVSARARDLLLTLLAAQRRSLLSEDHYDADPRGSHTLLSARALLTLAEELSA